MKIKKIELENGHSLFVEVLEVEFSDDIEDNFKKKKSIISDLPEDADPINAIDDMKNNIKMGMELLKDDLRNIVESVQDALIENQPDKFSVEVSFGFAGEGAIPFIASAKADGGIKVKATWKKGSTRELYEKYYSKSLD